MEKLSNLFKALSDPNRLRILKMLEIRPLCVCEITRCLGLATSTVSKHLSILKENGLVLDEKDGKWVTYRIKLDMESEYHRYLLPLFRGWLNENQLIQKDSHLLSNISRYTICSLEEK